MIVIQGRAGERGPPRTGGLESGFKEQVGFAEEGWFSRLWKEMKGLALSRAGLMETWHRGLPLDPCPG